MKLYFEGDLLCLYLAIIQRLIKKYVCLLYPSMEPISHQLTSVKFPVRVEN